MKIKRFVIGSFITVFSFIVVMFCLPTMVEQKYLLNYYVNSFLLTSCLIIYFRFYYVNKFDIFSPFNIVSLIYITMFFITPMYDLVQKEYYWFGIDLFSYGIKGSFIAFLGYFTFSFFSFYTFKYRENDKVNKNIEIKNIKKNKWITLYIYVGYIICLVANIWYLMKKNGTSILYIFTLGMMGSSNSLASTGDINAISMLSYALPSYALMICEYEDKKFVKVISFLLMFVLQVARGFRFFILQIIIMYASYYCIRKNKKPKLSQVFMIGIFTMIPIILMTLFRTSIRGGSGMNFSILNFKAIQDAIDAAVWDNFRIYKTYYGLIKAVPNLTGYLFGKQIFVYTLIMFIPRAIWKNKPGNPGTEAQRLGIGKQAVLGGSAYPGIGEYYYEFGVFGVGFFMAIFAIYLKNIQRKYRYNANTCIDLMKYSTIIGTILQFVIRGYTPSNFWMLVFCVLPYYFLNKLNRKGELCE